MSDPLEVTDSQPFAQGEPAPEAPAPAPVDLEAIKQELRAEFDQQMQERVTGLQRLISERDEELAQLRLEQMPESERERLEIEQTEQYYANIERENWLWRKQAASPEAAEAAKLLGSFVNAPDRDAQFDILLQAIRQYRQGTMPEGVPQAGEAPTPEVDRNNPAPMITGPTATAPDGTPIDLEFANRFLNAMKEWPAS